MNPPPRRADGFVAKMLLVSRGAPENDGHPQRPDRRGPQYRKEEVRTCMTGWWLITVPHGVDVRAVQFAPGGGPHRLADDATDDALRRGIRGAP